MTRASHLWWVSPALAGVLSATNAPSSPGLAVLAPIQPPRGASAAMMRGHFDDAIRIHEAIVRGDVNSAREPARRLAEYPADAWPGEGRRYVAGLAMAAAQVKTAKEPAAAAAATASMLVACGDCHRATGHTPAPSAVSWRSERGGIVGNMLEHEAAAGELFRGLVIPSVAAWRNGAARLRTATLRDTSLRSDPSVTRTIAAYEKRLHETAARAVAAGNQARRAMVYAELITQCAGCHSLRPNVWGQPSR
jgi:cytochrome c553